MVFSTPKLCMCMFIIDVHVQLASPFLYEIHDNLYVVPALYCLCTELQLKSYHLPCKLFKKWKDLLSQYTNTAYDDICQGTATCTHVCVDMCMYGRVIQTLCLV